MVKKRHKFICLLLSLSLILCSFGCSKTQTDECPYEEFLVIDVFDTLANYQGIQSGWFAKIVKDKFNMELNIISRNVSGGGDTLFDTRAAAGNLGDLVIFGADDGSLDDLVNAGLLTDMSDMLKGKEIMKYERAIRALNDRIDTKAIYAIPSEVSSNASTISSEALELNYGPYLRWDIYARLGYPKISTLEDLLPVLKQMQELEPYSESGKPTYAFSFFKDWDGNLMTAAKQPACLYGYDESGFLLLKADDYDYQSIIDDDSYYIRVLKLYFDANQMGLVDPDSYTQNYTMLFDKYKDGQILYSPWPWLGQSAYNNSTHTSEGKGFMLAPIDDMQVYSYGCQPDGNAQTVIAIGSGAQDPERLADFINWLYSPEGIQLNSAQNSSSAGPEGLTWELTENGPELTDFGVDVLYNGKDLSVPDEYGGGKWSDGISTLNYKAVTLTDLDENGYPYAYNLWDSVLALSISPLQQDWNRFMKATNTIEYLTEHNQIIVSPGCNFCSSAESSDISTMREQCSATIVEYSWKMIFAEDEAEFYSLLKEMQDTVLSLGYEQVLAYDIENAGNYAEARIASANLYKEESTNND